MDVSTLAEPAVILTAEERQALCSQLWEIVLGEENGYYGGNTEGWDDFRFRRATFRLIDALEWEPNQPVTAFEFPLSLSPDVVWLYEHYLLPEDPEKREWAVDPSLCGDIGEDEESEWPADELAEHRDQQRRLFGALVSAVQKMTDALGEAVAR